MKKLILIMLIIVSSILIISPTVLVSQLLQTGASKAKNTIQLQKSKKPSSKYINEFRIDSILIVYGKEIVSNSVKFNIDEYILISILYSLSDLNVDLTKSKISQNESNNYKEALELYVNNSKKYQELIDLYINQAKLRNDQVTAINERRKQRDKLYEDQLQGRAYNPYLPGETNAFAEGTGIDPGTGTFTVSFSSEPMQYPEVKLPDKLVLPTYPTFNSEINNNLSYVSGLTVLSEKLSNYLTNNNNDYEKAISILINTEGWNFSNEADTKNADIIIENAKKIKIYIDKNY